MVNFDSFKLARRCCRVEPILGTLFLSLVWPSLAQGQLQWEYMSQATFGPRAWHEISEDTVGDRLVLQGGMTTSGATYAYDGQLWTRIATNGPDVWGHGFVFDQARDEHVLYGGIRPTGGLNRDTWIFDGSSWRALGLSPQELPSAYSQHCMAFDERRGEVILFGGFSGTGFDLAET